MPSRALDFLKDVAVEFFVGTTELTTKDGRCGENCCLLELRLCFTGKPCEPFQLLRCEYGIIHC